MRFYILPTDQGTTACINFDHVASIAIAGPIIELYFVGMETPMTIPKTTATLSTISKGMDLSDSSKEQICLL